jgi:hypothetical protein
MTIVVLTKSGQYELLDGQAERRLGQNTDFELDWRDVFGGFVGGTRKLGSLI